MALKVNMETPQGLKIPGAYVQVYQVELKKQGATLKGVKNPKTKKVKQVQVSPEYFMLNYICLVFANKEKRDEGKSNHISNLRLEGSTEWDEKTNPFKTAYQDLKSQKQFKNATDC